MPKEYRTIQEVAGPLMLVRGVENVHFDELGEIELANGETRRCRVLEIDGSNALVQLFESSTGINLSNSKVRFLGRSMELGVSEDMLGPVSYTHLDVYKRQVPEGGLVKALWFVPLNDPMKMLIYSMAFGVIDVYKRQLQQ